jgi:hypothetical protein
MTLNHRNCLLACALAIGATQAQATAPATTKTATPAQTRVPANALHLATLLGPADKVIDQGLRLWEAAMRAELTKSADDAATAAANPGLVDAVVDAVRPIVRNQLSTKGLPERQQRYARLFADKLTPSDIDQLIAFYSSATGQKVIAGMYAVDQADQTIDAMRKHPDGLTAEDALNVTRSRENEVAGKLDADDWKAMYAFGVSPTGQKMKALVPQLGQLNAEMANETDPAEDAAIDQAYTAAVNAYMARKAAAAKH